MKFKKGSVVTTNTGLVVLITGKRALPGEFSGVVLCKGISSREIGQHDKNWSKDVFTDTGLNISDVIHAALNNLTKRG